MGETDAAGALIGSPFTYDPYGRPDAAHGFAGPRFRYTGQISLMPDIPLWHYKARAYDPAIGRFLQTDPIGYEDSLNLYQYVGNDPFNGTDPTGMVGCPLEVQDCEDRMYEGARDTAQHMTPGQAAVVVTLLAAPTAAVAAPAAAGMVLRDPIAAAELAAMAGEAAVPGVTFTGAAGAVGWRAIQLRPDGVRLRGTGMKSAAEIGRRGWSQQDVSNAVVDNVGLGATINRSNDNPATAYFISDNQYVVIDDVTGAVVQASDRLDPGWIVDDDIVRVPQ